MINFWCDNCGKTMKTHDEDAGKKCKCPNCEKIITIPMPLTAEPVANSEPVPARIPTPSESPPDATPATPAAPVGSDKEKIKYKCPECGEKLENTGSMGGSEDKCPLCGNIHTVPLSKGQKKTVREQEAQREREEEEVRSRQESYQREDVRREEEQAELLELPSHDTLCFISLLIPLIGLIVGVMLLTRSDAKENGTGNSCLIYAGIGFVIWIVFTVLITLILAVNARGI
jgi:DNA-directed RNA polymerase subunit RPC12/RpoP/phage FluMu protein Com